MVRVWPGIGGLPRRFGRSLIQLPKVRAETRLESSFGLSRIQKTLLAKNSATGRVMPEKRCMKNLMGCWQ